MDTNIGRLDQAIRIAGIFITAIFYFFNRNSGIVSTLAGIICVYCFMTALTQYSPIWELLGISTVKKKTVEIAGH